MGDQLNISFGIAFVRVDAIDARIRRNVSLPLGERQPYTAQRTQSVLFLQKNGQKTRINGVRDLALPGALLGGTGNVSEMILDTARVVARLLVSGTSLSKT